MKIVRIHVRNFRTLSDVTVSGLSPELSIIIGKNASGKSNLIAALRFFTTPFLGGPTMALEDISQGAGLGPATVTLDVDLSQDEIKSVLVNDRTAGLADHEREAVQKLADSFRELRVTATFSIAVNANVLYAGWELNRRGGVKINDILRDGFTQSGTPYRDTIAQGVQALLGRYIASHIIALGPVRMPRGLTTSQPALDLDYDAANLGNALYPEVAGYSKAYEDLVKQLNEVFPFVERPVTPPVQAMPNQIEVAFRESGIGFPVALGRASSGEVEAATLLLRLVSAPSGSFVSLEEPEAHFHPSGLKKVMGIVQRHARERIQVLIATHSTNLLSDTRLSAEQPIWYFSREDNGPTTVTLRHREHDAALIEADMSED